MTTVDDRESTLERLVQDVRVFLGFHRDLGLDSYPFALPWREGKTERCRSTARNRTEKDHPGESLDAAVLPAAGNSEGKADPRGETLRRLSLEADCCCRCGRAAGRQFCVFGEGTIDADVLIIPEAPDPAPGEALVMSGEERELLAKMLTSINLQLGQVYLTALVKCGVDIPKKPSADEFAACRSLLQQQVDVIKPKIILVFGERPAQLLLQNNQPLLHLRGRLHDVSGVPVLASYHPSQLLADTAMKRFAWTRYIQHISDWELETYAETF